MQNWTTMGRVKMNNEIADYIVKNDFFLIFREEEDEESKKTSVNVTICDDGKNSRYPWIAYWPPRCRICRAVRCPCSRRPVPIQSLHHFTWRFFRGSSDPRKKGEIIHHQNLDKLDARLKNLGKGTRRVHGLAHRARAQRFSPRKRHDVGNLFRPPLPARVVSRPELVGTLVVPEKNLPKKVTKRQELGEMEYRLGGQYYALSDELAHLDSGLEIPPVPLSAWRSPRTRMLKIVVPKLDPSPGESVFVMLLVKHGFVLDDVVRETGEHPNLLRAMFKRPAVSRFLELWRTMRVLPLAPVDG